MKSLRLTIILGAVAVLVLTGASLAAVALVGGPRPRPVVTGCSSPSFAGTVVDVTLADMGRGMMTGGRMRLVPEVRSVPHGRVSFVAANRGSVPHELVVLPLGEGQRVGARIVGADGRIGEDGAAGEASASCGEGAGDGVLPGAESWVTLTLAPGRYELVCNLPGHYAAGMYAELTVS
ncbi:hypothetical protein GCM10027449_10170 [Sinomonas notoginsengisoli]|uniref:sulfocyanin-like copper-binding protein n=1 Tax=Sinomonas notoginsengisoli TaxID=1457311 RepID=UPI001F1F80F8|nr:sulfocyanin-like copper-binding protein [Sinomonas notoginsengisoli]